MTTCFILFTERAAWSKSKNADPWEGPGVIIRLNCWASPRPFLWSRYEDAQDIGLRASIPQSELNQVWGVLRADPETLPTDHEQRYEVLKDRLRGGDVLQIAAALRDMAWREEQERRLTKQGKRLYDESLMLLAGEVAITQGSDLSTAEAQIMDTLKESVAPSPVA